MMRDSASHIKGSRPRPSLGDIIRRSKLLANKKSDKSEASMPDYSSPPPALLPLDAMPALDMTEHGAQLDLEPDSDLTGQPR